MTPPARQPLHLPPGVPLPFSGEEAVRRLVHLCMVGPQSRVLLLGLGNGAVDAAVWLARNVDPELVLADRDDARVAEARARLEREGLAQRAWFQRVDPHALPWGEGEFSSIWVDPKTFGELEPAVRGLRPHLVLKGRLCLQWPVRVSRQGGTPLERTWEARTGGPLLTPREILQGLAEAGYEPQTAECLSDAELEALYGRLESEAASGRAPPPPGFADELVQFRAQGGRSAVSFVLAVARRKEPGEKPPPSRSE